MSIDKSNIQGLVLAGGQGRRMGGLDKGLVEFDGVPLALRAARRLEPQVGSVWISAARNLEAYAAWGHHIVLDANPDSQGPLAGALSALRQCRKPFLSIVPCDVPLIPADLVERLCAAMEKGQSLVAMPLAAQEGEGARPDPTFMLIRREALPNLEDYFSGGGRKMTAWAGKAGLCLAPFTRPSDAASFLDTDTHEALARVEALARMGS